MMEIEKLYENAGFKKDLPINLSDLDFSEEDCDELCLDNSCDECRYKTFPPFTAEKQIAILMFILNKFGDIGFQKMYSIRGNDESTRKDFIKCLCDCEHETLDSRPIDFYYQKDASGDNLKESLAGLINNLWQNLTEQEKEQIKEILK